MKLYSHCRRCSYTIPSNQYLRRFAVFHFCLGPAFIPTEWDEKELPMLRKGLDENYNLKG